MNRRFSRPAAKPEDAHAPVDNVDLKTIMCLEHERVVANNYVVRFEKRLFQILKSSKSLPRPNNKVTVRVGLDGTISIIWKETKLLVKELTNTLDHKFQKVA